MKRNRCCGLIAATACVALALILFGGCRRAPTGVVVDLNGNSISPAASTNTVVLIFIAPECPISNRYAPEMKRLSDEFAASARFWFVYVDPEASASQITEHLKEYHLPLTALRDPHHELVQLAQVRVTPEAAVFDGGKLVYHGRIDDRYPSFGVDRGAPTERNLEQVLLALASGKQIAPSSRPAVGCVIPPTK